MTRLRLPSVFRLTLSLILLTVVLAACAAEAPTVAPAQPEEVEASVTSPPAIPTTDTSAQGTALPTEVLAATVVPAATSRGPELHASDPTAVSLASGGLQLVEFFRFT